MTAISPPFGTVTLTPLPVRVLLGICATAFVLYIPVALLRSTAPLLILDASLAVLVVLTLSCVTPKRLVGGSAAVWCCLALVGLSIVPAIMIDNGAGMGDLVKGLRSVLFGMVMLLVASAWLDTAQRADRFVQILLLGATFAALYAVRQVLFGLLPFELERLALMGSSEREMDVLGRIRIPSTFGDPVTFAFFAMLGVCMFVIARLRGQLPLLTRRLALPVLLLLGMALGVTLTRAAMLGLACAFIWLLVTSSRFGVRWVLRMTAIAGLGLGGLLALNQVVTSNVLADSDVQWVRTANNTLSAVWTLIPAAASGEVGAELDKLRGVSATSRKEAWTEGLEYLVRHPLGGGLGTMTSGGGNEISFSPIDVGILRFGLELGWVGMAGVAGLWLSVLVVGIRKWRRITDLRTRELGRGLLGAWLAIGAAQSVTSFLHTELIGAVSWMIAALILNLDRIANSESARCAMQSKGVSQ